MTPDMNKPVKVNDPLYDQIMQHAIAEGMTIDEAERMYQEALVAEWEHVMGERGHLDNG